MLNKNQKIYLYRWEGQEETFTSDRPPPYGVGSAKAILVSEGIVTFRISEKRCPHCLGPIPEIPSD